MSDTQLKQGSIAGIIAGVLAVLGIIFWGIVFIPLAFIVAIFGTIKAIKSKNMSGILINVFAWVLIIIGFFTSPLLLATIGLGVASL